MRTIRVTDANRQFFSVLKQVTKGEEFLIVSRGKPVANITPVKESGKERAAARNILFKRLRKQVPAGPRSWTRDELYERKT